jgi:hypothetical protein
MHARIENNTVVEYPIVNLRQRLPNSSLPADLSKDELLPDGFVYVHITPPPEFNTLTHKITVKQPEFDGVKWSQGYEAVPLSDEEAAEAAARPAAQQALSLSHR